MVGSIDKVGLAVIRDNKLLLVRNDGTKLFLMPGGRVEEYDKSDEEALQREILEELGCGVVTESIHFIEKFSDVAANDPGRIVEIKLFVGELTSEPRCSSEIAELLWHDLGDKDLSRLSPIVANKIVPFFANRHEV